ncbi:MAG: endonuclease domain-containing protein [Caulobacterales bacterium]|jgi:very-short-patch-repair endonuclease
MDGTARVKRARTLRSNPTATERLLWSRLRQRRLGGLKFRRQVPMGPYVLDFLCLRHRLVVEADGPFHDPQRDASRDAWLNAKGFRVLRFSNEEIRGAPDLVAARILAALDELGPVPTI